MKKTLLLILALMPSLLSHSQEANEDNFIELSVIPRIETSTYYDADKHSNVLGLGDSSIYSLFEGQVNNLSWTISTHFIHAGGDYGWPYTSLGYSNTTNFIDYFVANYSFGDFTFSLGKDVIKTGGFEFEDWDWEINSALATPLWNNLASYQWGASVTWDFLENQSIAFQAVSSPFGEHPFSSKLYTCSLQWRAEFDWASFIWSVSSFGMAPGEYRQLFCLGQSFDITDNLNLTFDWTNCSDFLLKGNTLNTQISYSFNDKLDCRANLIYSSPKEDFLSKILVTGLTINYYPIEDLRLYLNGTYDCIESNPLFMIGARYYLRLIK